RLYAAGAEWVQIDEPYLCTDLDASTEKLYRDAYSRLTFAASFPKLMLTTYFAHLGTNLELALSLATAGMHVDLVRAPEQLGVLLAKCPASLHLSLGLVDGRNVWRTDIERALTLLEAAIQGVGNERIEVAPSCSLLHAPLDLDAEKKFDPELRGWMAFGKQKLEEVAILARALEGRQAIQHELEKNREFVKSRKTSSRIHNPKVQQRLQAVDESMLHRKNPYPARSRQQTNALSLPQLPTTTIGSFPQTDEVRKMRAAERTEKIYRATYDAFLEQEIERTIRFQEEIGLDVLVHGEFERNDMVEYFGEQLEGFAFSQQGWVQSYGSRCVKPPIIYGDVWRPSPMTVRWATFAQSLSDKPVKGMLTGPVTILQWSFVRDDQPRANTCRQIALAIRDEVKDLEIAGIRIIQIDEPAIREGLPLHRAEWAAYLQWSVDAFRLASSVASDDTQIHTHMCYSEFNDIIKSIARMDADVISIECSRSRMELLDAFHHVRYPNGIGPGVYDVHSQRVPPVEEMEDLLKRALQVLSPQQLWVNPDCGLKTRAWTEVRPALKNMVATAKKVRQSL
ncbi:MAG: 5-methyltetrahydropteroyltriglutamate--homocysteine S-methyltransferase, partial [Acidobacteriaceae bacterium]